MKKLVFTLPVALLGLLPLVIATPAMAKPAKDEPSQSQTAPEDESRTKYAPQLRRDLCKKATSISPVATYLYPDQLKLTARQKLNTTFTYVIKNCGQATTPVTAIDFFTYADYRVQVVTSQGTKYQKSFLVNQQTFFKVGRLVYGESCTFKARLLAPTHGRLGAEEVSGVGASIMSNGQYLQEDKPDVQPRHCKEPS